MDFSRRWLYFGAGITLLVVVAIIVWRTQLPAASESLYQTVPVERGRLLSSVGATGTVRAGQSAILTWQADGRVEAVNVSVGDTVKTDEVLASLAENSLAQSIVLAEVDLVTARQNLESLTTSNLALAQAQQNLANATQGVEDAQAAFDRLNRVWVSDQLIENTQAELDQVERQLKFQEWIFDKFYAGYYDGNPRKAEQIVNLNNTRVRRDALIAKLNWYTSQPTELEIQKSRAALNLARARMNDAQREVERLGDGRNAADVAAAQARVDAAQSTLNLARIIAPFEGVITEAQVLPGDLVSRGGQAFRLENLERLFVDLQVSEVDINSIALDQAVSVSFDAILTKTYTGKVVKINLVGETVNGAVNFPVTVELTDADELVKPGMTAAVTVTVREVQNALLVPNRAVRVVNGERVVYILRDDQPVAVKIRLGALSDFESEVVGGDLQAGDLVILNPPAPVTDDAGL